MAFTTFESVPEMVCFGRRGYNKSGGHDEGRGGYNRSGRDGYNRSGRDGYNGPRTCRKGDDDEEERKGGRGGYN
jgi:hypothetical protein